MNAYQVLNLPSTASYAEVKAAYRSLARRWHPDRFAEGPERDWANEKMAEINAAYRACIHHAPRTVKPANEQAELKRIESLIDGGQYLSARRLLMSVSTRCAEWNYLFGSILLKMQETDKALIYLSVATHQQPNNAKYVRMLSYARAIQNSARSPLFARLRRTR